MFVVWLKPFTRAWRKCDSPSSLKANNLKKKCHPCDSAKIFNSMTTCHSGWQARGARRAEKLTAECLSPAEKGSGGGRGGCNHDKHDSLHCMGPQNLRNVIKKSKRQNVSRAALFPTSQLKHFVALAPLKHYPKFLHIWGKKEKKNSITCNI